MSEPPMPESTPETEAGVNSRRTSSSLIFSGNRSVSSMTVAQRERKRANDRRSQRASRARTRQHIHHLERELESLRHIGPEESGDENSAIQELVRRNQELEIELIRLRSTSASPLSTSSNFSNISSARQVHFQSPRDQVATDAPSVYIPEVMVPVDGGQGIGPTAPLPAPPLPGSFGNAPDLQSHVDNYSLPISYASVDIPRSTPNSRLNSHNNGYSHDGIGTVVQHPQYAVQTNAGPAGTIVLSHVEQQEAGALTREFEATSESREYNHEASRPPQPTCWDQWQMDGTSGETE
ncbi:hypothetical protein VFPPC_10108 [Pochonia chlamydosporia 170]|uniref:BZIP domain-containing protein n=1 Tax=Pochonia chlamydosporia 170 TaxID=1380566 RepID=A0A179F3M9_METCM|nr:hypothetical protein VFPPC_10108 [Pochonia chlamydosporia 170]OAQ60025.1 hypothetical protein VFPPC_10108 [Pochonia chlamydosporia 170]